MSGGSGASLSLRRLTRSSLEEILCRGSSSGGHSAKVEWSVLVFDEFGKDLIAPILKVGDIRKMGITLFLRLESQREPVPDAPAIYLCQPTEEAVKKIAQDCVEDKYRSYSIHFTSPISRKLLELFACELQGRSTIANIVVKDQFLSFVSPEPDLFSLQIPHSYYTIGSVHTTSEQIDGYFDLVTNGIMHVLLTLQMVPIVVSVDTAAAKELATTVITHIKDMIREHYLTPHAEVTRPVLIISDRNSDLATPLIQPFTYRALLHDTLGMKLNKVTTKKDGKSVDYDLEETDPLWQETARKEFPEVLEATKQEADILSKEKDAFQASGDDVDDQTLHLTNVMQNASSVVQRKRHLTVHSALQDQLHTAIVTGKLDEFNGLAEEMLHQGVFNQTKIAQLVKGDASEEQRVRLALLFYLLSDPDEKSRMDAAKDLEGYLTRNAPPRPEPGAASSSSDALAAGSSSAATPPHLAFKYLRKVRGFMPQQKGGVKGPQGAMGGLFSGKRVLDDLVRAVKGGGQQFLAHTRLVDAVLQTNAAKRNEERMRLIQKLDCVDPKTGQTINLSSLTFNTGLLFVVGGGSFVEYEDLKNWQAMDENKDKAIVYGSTELLTGNEFLNQLAHLGEE